MSVVSPAPSSVRDDRRTEKRASKADTDNVHASSAADAAFQNTSASVDEVLNALQDSLHSAPANFRPSQVSSDFREQLQLAFSACETLQPLLQNVAQTLSRHAAMDCVAWYSGAGERIGQRPDVQILSGGENSADLQQCLLESGARGVAAAAGFDQQILNAHQAAVAVSVPALPGHCLIGLTKTVSGAVDSAQSAAVELAAARVSEWQQSRMQLQAIADAQHIAALVELLGQIASCRTSKASARRLVDQLRPYLGASDVAFGRCSGGLLKCRLTAVASLPDIDEFSEAARITEAVLQESLARNCTSVWPATDDSQRHALLSHQYYGQQLRAEAVVSTPLRDAQGQFVGALAATFDDPAAAQEAQRFLFAAERHLGTALDFVQRSQQTFWEKCRAAALRWYASWKVRTALLFCVLLFGLLAIPVDYRVSCETELQPVSRRFVAAPFAAPLEECLAEPGDIVEADQLLAVLDGRELRWELAGLRADLARANKEHNAFLSEQKFGEAAIARHEIERLQNQSALLTERTRNLEIRSPIAGVLVSGDLKETEGVPLETGQSLFEVAPLDHMLIEVAIPEDDVRHVAPGMEIRLRLDADRSEVLTGQIKKLLPSATLREHQNVFIAEARVPNESRQLRPGMKGTAKVSTGAKPVGWILFHKPVAEVVGWLGW